MACETWMPSFALEEPVRPRGAVPANWGAEPVFTVEGTTHVAHVAVEPGTDLYGTGEIAGPLLRNGKRTRAWTEMPNPSGGSGAFRFDDTFDHRYRAHPWVLGVRADGSAFGVFADTTRHTFIDLTDGVRFEAEAPFPVIVLEGALGGHRHAATWTGDNTTSWNHLRWSIAMIANLGLSGQPFAGADIGGFMVPPGTEGTPDPWDPELFAHWVGIGAFYPFCRNHAAGLDDPSTRILGGGPTHHVWNFGPEIERTSR